MKYAVVARGTSGIGLYATNFIPLYRPKVEFCLSALKWNLSFCDNR